MKIRIKFRKWGAMKFIGHLDMMRYFQKAVRRAKIDICYSEGFSPHQIMSFAAPLGVGITSDGEYFDIEVHSTKSTGESIRALNAAMVDGVEVIGYVLLPDQAKTAMSLVTAADYQLSFKEKDTIYTKSQWQKLVAEHFTGAQEFRIVKKTKKSERELDLKPLVYSFEVRGTEDSPEFFLSVSTGSSDNIKPELVLSSLYERLGLDYQPQKIRIHRIETYTTDAGGKLVPLLALGEEIQGDVSDCS